MVDSFVRHFQEFLDGMAELPDQPSLVVLKKLGCVAAIDALSKVGSQEHRGNPNRFVHFVRNFSGWGDCERMSLPHLVHALSAEVDSSFEKLSDYAHDLLRVWSTDYPGPCDLTVDPMPAEIHRLWPQKGNGFKKLRGRLLPGQFQHAYLLYSYRNALAHELQESGWPTIEDGASDPYYQFARITRLGDEGEASDYRERWLLYYPLAFFFTLAQDCLSTLRNWLDEQQVDPYARYPQRDCFLEQLDASEETVNPAPAPAGCRRR